MSSHRGIMLIVLLPLVEVKSLVLPLVNTYGQASSLGDFLRQFCQGSDLEQLGTITALIGIVVIPVIFARTLVDLLRQCWCHPRSVNDGDPSASRKQTVDSRLMQARGPMRQFGEVPISVETSVAAWFDRELMDRTSSQSPLVHRQRSYRALRVLLSSEDRGVWGASSTKSSSDCLAPPAKSPTPLAYR